MHKRCSCICTKRTILPHEFSGTRTAVTVDISLSNFPLKDLRPLLWAQSSLNGSAALDGTFSLRQTGVDATQVIYDGSIDLNDVRGEGEQWQISVRTASAKLKGTLSSTATASARQSLLCSPILCCDLRTLPKICEKRTGKYRSCSTYSLSMCPAVSDSSSFFGQRGAAGTSRMCEVERKTGQQWAKSGYTENSSSSTPAYFC